MFTDEFPSQRASNMENVSMSQRQNFVCTYHNQLRPSHLGNRSSDHNGKFPGDRSTCCHQHSYRAIRVRGTPRVGRARRDSP